MIKVSKLIDVLNVSFDYEADTVALIKTIPGRKYKPDTKSWDIPFIGIHKLKELFGEKLDIDADVDQDYKLPKYSFENELPNIKYKPLRVFTKWCLEQLPDYFYEIPASSTGKYHPAYALGEGGLVRHTRAALGIAEELFKNETVQQFNDLEKDVIRVALTLHDGCKNGLDGSAHTVTTHPLDVMTHITQRYWKVDEDSLPDEVIEITESDLYDTIDNCIRSHMGRWCTDRDGKQILPKPDTELEKFIHLCDYLASRKCLEFNFEMEG